MGKALRGAGLMLALGGFAGLGGHEARGYSYFTYGGYPVIWSDNVSLRYLSPGTFPPGSATDVLIQAAMGQWSSVWGADFTYYYIRLTEDPYIDHFDGYSDTAAVPAESLDPGVLGVTYMVNYYDVWYDMDLLFSDYPENVGWHMLADPDCQITANPMPDNGFSFYLVALHELGHCLGLGHDPIGNEPPGTTWFIATMNPGYPAGGPVGNQNIVELHTDDRRAMRFLYPGMPVVKIDLANAGYGSHGPRLGRAVPAFVTPQPVTPGQELTAWAVIENFGTVAVADVRQGFYLSTDDAIDADDLLLGDVLWDLPNGGAYEFSAGIDIPDLAPGTYYLGSILDDLGEVAEEYEDNNQADYCDPLVVAQAAPAFAPFSQYVITCAAPFIGPTPVVTYPVNMAPIAWSLDNPQPGMTIDPATGVISWPAPIKSPFIYELGVRATNAAGTSVQTLRLGVQQAAPHIAAIANQAATCGAAYTGPTPVLTAPDCMAPILGWSLVSGPPDMTINAGSGVVSWSPVVPGQGPYIVTIRALNEIGEATESWLLYVASAEGDLDGNEAVDLDDVELFTPCLAGPQTAFPADCVCADFDQDDDVDLADFAQLMTAYSGTIVREGACCIEDGSCSVVTPAYCYTIGGYYQGDATTCGSVTCTGACCFYTGGCLSFTLDFCNIAGGTFQGMGSVCGDLTCPAAGQGACCFPTEVCLLRTAADCTATGGQFRGLGLACEAVDCTAPQGACCQVDGACTVGGPAACFVTGGTYMGDQSTCTATVCQGACCYPDGACLELAAPDCATSAGVFEGPLTHCATFSCPVEAVGACCYADGTCTSETEARCAAFSGSYQGDEMACAAVDCSPPGRGACCLPDETCQVITPAACAWRDGTFIDLATTCAGLSCSLAELGACYDPVDWTCQITVPGICAALGGTYEGGGTTCAGTLAPEYRNQTANPTTFYTPGANVALADDLTLGGTARGLTYYDLAVVGTGGGSYGVTVALHDNCPGAGGALIAGTQQSWSAVPADGFIYLLSADFSAAPVRLPDAAWMVVTFTSADAGWVLAGPAETGTTADLFGQNDPPWACDYWFGGGPGDFAGFWTDVQCVELPEPQGACCHADHTCTAGPLSACTAAAGMFMGEGTTCAGVSCASLDFGACCDLVTWTCTLTTAADCAAAGGSFDGIGTTCTHACPEYRNDIDPIVLSYNPGQPMADDLTLAGTARDLAYFEIAVYGGGGGPFDLSVALYDGSPCSGGAMIPGTLVSGAGLPDGQVLDLTVTLPAPVTLPDQPWVVVEFSTAYAGWIVAEEAETGTTGDYFALAEWDGRQWTWTCDNQVSNPPDDPHAGFWFSAQCIDAGSGRAPARPSADPEVGRYEVGGTVDTEAGRHNAPDDSPTLVVRPVPLPPGGVRSAKPVVAWPPADGPRHRGGPPAMRRLR